MDKIDDASSEKSYYIIPIYIKIPLHRRIKRWLFNLLRIGKRNNGYYRIVSIQDAKSIRIERDE